MEISNLESVLNNNNNNYNNSYSYDDDRWLVSLVVEAPVYSVRGLGSTPGTQGLKIIDEKVLQGRTQLFLRGGAL